MIKFVYKKIVRGNVRRIIGKIIRYVKSERFDHSQALEFTKLKPLFDSCDIKRIIDIGANDGKSYSNSYPLLKRCWEGLLVEANPKHISTIKKNLTGSKFVVEHCAITPDETDFVYLRLDSVTRLDLRASIRNDGGNWVKENLSDHKVRVTTHTIKTLLDRHPDYVNSDVLSIDIEGLDSDVLISMPTDFKPAIIIAEIDFEDIEKAHRRLENMINRGYVLVARIGCNEIFLNKDSYLIKKQEVKTFIQNNF